jgi:hypothetical protein
MTEKRTLLGEFNDAGADIGRKSGKHMFQRFAPTKEVAFVS